MKRKVKNPDADFEYQIHLLFEAATDEKIDTVNEDMDRILSKLENSQKMLFMELILKLKEIETLNVELLLKKIAVK